MVHRHATRSSSFADAAAVLDEMSIAGWQHYMTVPGGVDGHGLYDHKRQTHYFRRPASTYPETKANGEAGEQPEPVTANAKG